MRQIGRSLNQFSYAVEWGLIHKIPLPRDAPKVNIEERTIWDEKTMLAALQTIENPALHLAVHMSMILSLREGEILGLQPSDLDFDLRNILSPRTPFFRICTLSLHVAQYHKCTFSFEVSHEISNGKFRRYG